MGLGAGDIYQKGGGGGSGGGDASLTIFDSSGAALVTYTPSGPDVPFTLPPGLGSLGALTVLDSDGSENVVYNPGEGNATLILPAPGGVTLDDVYNYLKANLLAGSYISLAKNDALRQITIGFQYSAALDQILRTISSANSYLSVNRTMSGSLVTGLVLAVNVPQVIDDSSPAGSTTTTFSSQYILSLINAATQGSLTVYNQDGSVSTVYNPRTGDRSITLLTLHDVYTYLLGNMVPGSYIDIEYNNPMITISFLYNPALDAILKTIASGSPQTLQVNRVVDPATQLVAGLSLQLSVIDDGNSTTYTTYSSTQIDLLLQQLRMGTMNFAGYVSSADPSGISQSIRSGIWWQNSLGTGSPGATPFQAAQWNAATQTWGSPASYTPNDWDVWHNANDSSTWFWFANAWHPISSFGIGITDVYNYLKTNLLPGSYIGIAFDDPSQTITVSFLYTPALNSILGTIGSGDNYIQRGYTYDGSGNRTAITLTLDIALVASYIVIDGDSSETTTYSSYYIDYLFSQIRNGILNFIGYVSGTDPSAGITGTLKTGTRWQQQGGTGSPPSGTFAANTWNGSAWAGYTNYTPQDWDVWYNSNDQTTWYWFANQWHPLNFSVDLTPYVRWDETYAIQPPTAVTTDPAAETTLTNTITGFTQRIYNYLAGLYQLILNIFRYNTLAVSGTSGSPTSLAVPKAVSYYRLTATQAAYLQLSAANLTPAAAAAAMITLENGSAYPVTVQASGNQGSTGTNVICVIPPQSTVLVSCSQQGSTYASQFRYTPLPPVAAQGGNAGLIVSLNGATTDITNNGNPIASNPYLPSGANPQTINIDYNPLDLGGGGGGGGGTTFLYNFHNQVTPADNVGNDAILSFTQLNGQPISPLAGSGYYLDPMGQQVYVDQVNAVTGNNHGGSGRVWYDYQALVSMETIVLFLRRTWGQGSQVVLYNVPVNEVRILFAFASVGTVVQGSPAWAQPIALSVSGQPTWGNQGVNVGNISLSQMQVIFKINNKWKFMNLSDNNETRIQP